MLKKIDVEFPTPEELSTKLLEDQNLLIDNVLLEAGVDKMSFKLDTKYLKDELCEIQKLMLTTSDYASLYRASTPGNFDLTAKEVTEKITVAAFKLQSRNQGIFKKISNWMKGLSPMVRREELFIKKPAVAAFEKMEEENVFYDPVGEYLKMLVTNVFTEDAIVLLKMNKEKAEKKVENFEKLIAIVKDNLEKKNELATMVEQTYLYITQMDPNYKNIDKVEQYLQSVQKIYTSTKKLLFSIMGGAYLATLDHADNMKIAYEIISEIEDEVSFFQKNRTAHVANETVIVQKVPYRILDVSKEDQEFLYFFSKRLEPLGEVEDIAKELKSDKVLSLFKL